MPATRPTSRAAAVEDNRRRIAEAQKQQEAFVIEERWRAAAVQADGGNADASKRIRKSFIRRVREGKPIPSAIAVYVADWLEARLDAPSGRRGHPIKGTLEEAKQRDYLRRMIAARARQLVAGGQKTDEAFSTVEQQCAAAGLRMNGKPITWKNVKAWYHQDDDRTRRRSK